jgi:hypothetical protein
MPVCPSDNRGIKIKTTTDRGWDDTDRGNRSTERETCHSATLYTTNTTQTGLGLETLFRVENPSPEP